MKAQPKVGVIGGGGWGTALAVVANRAGSAVKLGTRNANVIAAIGKKRINEIYLPDVFLDPAIEATDDLREVCDSDLVIIAVPSHCMRSACIAVSDLIPSNVPIMLGSKGIERGSLLLMSEVVASVLPKNPLAVLSGPNFASETARGQPTATTIACADSEMAERILYAVGGKLFRPYLTDDITGTQIGGAVKNVIAIACGIAIGKELGENARAGLITRGFAEMARLCVAKGGKYETLTGLSGLGDLILTCSSTQSRNTGFGISLSRGGAVKEVIAGEGRGVIEGAVTVESAVKLARKHGIDMPICETVHRILNGELSVDEAIAALMDRPLTHEHRLPQMEFVN